MTQFHYHSYTFTRDTTRYSFKNEDEGGARTRELSIVSGRHGSDPTYLVHTPEKAILAAENQTTPSLAAPAALDKSEPMMLHKAALLAKTSQRLVEELICASTISNKYTAIFAKLSTNIHKVLASTLTAQEKSGHIIRLLADEGGDIERAKRKGLEIQAFVNTKLPRFLRSSSLPGVAVPKTVARYTDLAGLRDDELRQPLNDMHFRTISPALRQRRLSRLIGDEEVETSTADAESQAHQDVFNGFQDIPEREVIVIEDSEGEDIALSSRKRGRAASQKGESSRKSRRTRENGSEVAKAETPHGTIEERKFGQYSSQGLRADYLDANGNFEPDEILTPE
ncbi:hypothetical protein LZ554_003376 [Drepanopeziza brunnea f. sp. 'monogermtubi']|nr:hypothetical protein LZ554_003376 [Drepanopeziza brunnea f. sp. 'monogermtubi']